MAPAAEPGVHLALAVLPQTFSVCRLPANEPIPQWARTGEFSSITRTTAELSIVCESSAVPGAVRAERDWRALVVSGPLDFGLIGILAGLTHVLAEAGVSVFVVSTYDTDYVLVRAAALERAVAALQNAGYRVATG